MSLQLNHRSEIVLDGIPTGYIALQNEKTKFVQRVVKCSTNRDLKLPQETYSVIDESFENDFRAAYENA